MMKKTSHHSNTASSVSSPSSPGAAPRGSQRTLSSSDAPAHALCTSVAPSFVPLSESTTMMPS